MCVFVQRSFLKLSVYFSVFTCGWYVGVGALDEQHTVVFIDGHHGALRHRLCSLIVDQIGLYLRSVFFLPVLFSVLDIYVHLLYVFLYHNLFSLLFLPIFPKNFNYILLLCLYFFMYRLIFNLRFTSLSLPVSYQSVGLA